MNPGIVSAFRIVAFVEALTWLGLLIGMYFKWIAETGEAGVKIFGPIHGGVFVLYLLISLWTARKLSWNLVTTFWALVASVPPFGTVVFEVWAARTGRMGELSRSSAAKSEPSLV
jgi:integral membrane protein